jgi:NADPH:quinone reductase-like Zn-dependent oxidoreductase
VCLADDGRHVTIAFQRGAKAEIDMSQLMRRRLTMTGSTLRARSADFKAALADEIHKTLWPRLSSGAWKPAMDQAFPLADAAAAHARMQARTSERSSSRSDNRLLRAGPRRLAKKKGGRPVGRRP